MRTQKSYHADILNTSPAVCCDILEVLTLSYHCRMCDLKNWVDTSTCRRRLLPKNWAYAWHRSRSCVDPTASRDGRSASSRVSKEPWRRCKTNKTRSQHRFQMDQEKGVEVREDEPRRMRSRGSLTLSGTRQCSWAMRSWRCSKWPWERRHTASWSRHRSRRLSQRFSTPRLFPRRQPPSQV